MKINVSVPHFEVGSYSDRCNTFFDQKQEWEDSEDVNSPQWKKRTVTWAHYPYRYWLEQSGVESHHAFRRDTIAHKMFQVALLSARRSSDGRRELKRWYIIQPANQPEYIGHLSHLVDEPEVEKATGELVTNTDFILDNGLYVPNSEDMVQLDFILELGRLDGTEVINN